MNLKVVGGETLVITLTKGITGYVSQNKPKENIYICTIKA